MYIYFLKKIYKITHIIVEIHNFNIFYTYFLIIKIIHNKKNDLILKSFFYLNLNSIIAFPLE